MNLNDVLILIAEIGGALGAVAAIFSYTRKFFKWITYHQEKIEKFSKIIEYELANNGGKSLKDAVDRIESLVLTVEARQRGFFQAQTQDGLFEAKANGDFIYVNSTWSRITGVQPTEAVGSGWTSAVHVDDRDQVLEEWLDCAKYEREFDMKFRFKTLDGIITDVHTHAVPIRSVKTNEVIGFLGVVEVTKTYKETLKNIAKKENH